MSHVSETIKPQIPEESSSLAGAKLYGVPRHSKRHLPVGCAAQQWVDDFKGRCWLNRPDLEGYLQASKPHSLVRVEKSSGSP